MQLRLNPAHPLCQPSRNLVFATFGTGLGGQVIDLAERPSHGVIRDLHAYPDTQRSLQSIRPPGFPSDYSALTFRDPATVLSAVEFGNVAKVTSLTDNLTAAVWYRPYDISTDYTFPFNTTVGYTAGWHFTGTNLINGALWQDNSWGVMFLGAGGDERPRVADGALRLNQWNLMCFTYSSAASPKVVLYTNGQNTAIVYEPFTTGFAAGSNLSFGSYDGGTKRSARGDIGPAFVWGSVLTADEIAMLYRDTWGMVTTERMSLPVMVAAGATTTTTTTSSTTTDPGSCYQDRTRFGLFSYLPGCGAIQWRNSRFKRSTP